MPNKRRLLYIFVMTGSNISDQFSGKRQLLPMDRRYQNILYIDDEEYNLLVFKNAFFRHYNIFTALSGEEGLKIMQDQEIHMIITDQRMPGMTGIDVLEKVVETHPNAI